jgi:PEP-CTERM motif
MKIVKFVLPVVAAGFFASSAMAATTGIVIDGTNTVAGTVANLLQADGAGDDWTGEVLLVELTGGSVYNAPAFDNASQQSGFWGIVAGLQWDSAMGIAGDGSGGIAGGAGDLGGPGGANQIGLLGADAQPSLISVTAFNTDVTNTALVTTGTVTLSNDAAGTWSRITSFAGGLVQTSGIVENGALVPEPASLALMGLGGIAALRRRR